MKSVNNLNAKARTLGLLATCMLATSLCGCAIGRRGPVARGVIYARQLSQRGLDALHDGQVAEAEQHFKEAIGHCPTNVTARYQLANCLWKKGEREQAITRLSEAVEMSEGDDAEMMIELAYMQANQGKIDSARRLSERIIQKAPNDPRAWQLQGEVLKAAGEWKPALSSLHRALALSPDNLHVQLATAEIYQELGRPQRALTTLDHVAEQLPSNEMPESLAIMKSDALRALGRKEDAFVVLAEANRQQRLSDRGQDRLAQARSDLDRPYNRQQAIKQARRPADSQPRPSVEQAAQR